MNIKPSEISSILQMQLQNMSNKVQFEEIGKVLQVSDGVAHVYGLDKVQSDELVEFENGTMGVVLNLEEDNVGVVLLGPTEGIKEGETVRRTQRIASVLAGEGMLGRVVDGLGNPIGPKSDENPNGYTVTVTKDGNAVDPADMVAGETYTVTVSYEGDAANQPAELSITVTATTAREGEYPIDLSGSDPAVAPGSVVEVDGASYIVDEDGKIWVKETTHKIVVTYKYAESTSTIEPTYNGQSGPHYVYPTNMYVWYLTYDETEGYSAERVSELDNFLTYKGTSIRMSGNQGIRIFTAVPSDKRSSLIRGQLISLDAMQDYKLVEYGTIFQWLSTSGELIYDPNRANRSIAYSAETGYDAIFTRQGSDIWYTGMLVNLQLELCDDELLLRPYMVLENAAGERVVIHGGTLQRTIGYVALQNRDYKPDAASHNFIWNIIRAVYGKDFKYPA